jgi:hypothetical protein
MPLQTRPAAIKMSVLAFFLVAIIGQCYGVSSFYCCKRAMLAAIAAYIVTTLFIKAVNFILLNAMIDKEVDKQREFSNDN